MLRWSLESHRFVSKPAADNDCTERHVAPQLPLPPFMCFCSNAIPCEKRATDKSINVLGCVLHDIVRHPRGKIKESSWSYVDGNMKSMNASGFGQHEIVRSRPRELVACSWAFDGRTTARAGHRGPEKQVQGDRREDEGSAGYGQSTNLHGQESRVKSCGCFPLPGRNAFHEDSQISLLSSCLNLPGLWSRAYF